MSGEQYTILCARRQAFDSFVWQTPPLAIAAQAFLLATALDPDTAPHASIILASFSGFIGLASFQLIAKHRQFEKEDSERLRCFELAHPDFAVLHGKLDPLPTIKRSWLVKLSSYRIWSNLLLGFPLLAIYAGVSAVIG